MNRKNKQKQRRILWIISHVCVLFWMYVIFGFSAQNGESSGGLSGEICLAVTECVNDTLQLGWDRETVMETAVSIGYPVRKLAHMTEFGILAVLYYWALAFYPRLWSRSRRLNAEGCHYVLAFAMAVFYAALDEFHQLFIPDRSGNLFDVCVDSTGACFGLLFVWLCRRLFLKIKARQNEGTKIRGNKSIVIKRT